MNITIRDLLMVVVLLFTLVVTVINYSFLVEMRGDVKNIESAVAGG